MAEESEIRQRKPATVEEVSDSETENESKGRTVPQSVIKKEDSISTLDIFRSIFFLVLASCALSYFVTRESFVWNVARPKWTRVEAIQTFLVSYFPIPLGRFADGDWDWIEILGGMNR